MGAYLSLLAQHCVLIEPANHPAVLADSQQKEAPGVWRGLEEVMEGVRKVFTALRLTGVSVHEIVADGPSRVIGLVDVHGLDYAGQPYTLPLARKLHQYALKTAFGADIHV